MAKVAIIYYEGWAAHRSDVAGEPVAELDDVEWADALIFGTPTRYGNVSSQLQAFLDQTGGLWAEGKLADKVASAFTGSHYPHGGQESTLLSLYGSMYHWGAVVVTPGDTDERFAAAGGNPYGTSCADAPGEAELEAARAQGARVAAYAERLAGTRAGAAAG